MIGDVLTSSILCQAIKERFAESETHYLVNAHTTAVLENNLYIDKQIVFSPEMEESASLRGGLKTALKNEKYDVVIDVYSKLGSAALTKTTGARIRAGYRKWYTKWAYTHTFSYNKTPKTIAGLAIENRMLLLEPFQSDFPEYIKPKIYLTSTEQSKAKGILTQHGINGKKPLIMIALLGSSKEKTYPLEYMAVILDFLVATHSCQLLLNYIPKQQEQVYSLLSLVNQETKAFIFDAIYGKSLRDFFALTSQCNMIVGNEGGAINMAKAMGIPSFSIFSPWISREAWGLFENEKNVSFHLKDIHPEVYEDNKLKAIRKKVPDFYKLMDPEKIKVHLNSFLETNLK